MPETHDETPAATAAHAPVSVLPAPGDATLGVIRTLAGMPARAAKQTEAWGQADPVTRATVRWLRGRAVEAAKPGRSASKRQRRAALADAARSCVSDPRLAQRLAFEARRAELAAAAAALGLPEKVSPNQPYTKFGLRWHRDRLVTRLAKAGLSVAELELVANLAGRGWADHAWDAPLRQAAQVAARHAGEPADRGVAESSVSAQVREILAGLPQAVPAKRYAAIAATARLAALTRPVREAAQLRLAETLTLVAAGLDPADGADPAGAASAPGVWESAARLLAEREISGEDALTLARAVGGDVVKSRLLLRTWRERTLDSRTRERAAELAGLGRFDAVRRFGTLEDVAAAHLLTAGLDTHAAAVAMAATGRSPATAAAGNDEPVRAIRALPVTPFAEALAALRAEGPRAAEHQVVGAAVRFAVCFGRQWRAYVTSARAVAARLGKTEPALFDLSSWLPVHEQSREFGTWLTGRDRLQTLFRSEASLTSVRRIAAEFPALAADERELPVADAVARLRARAYGPLGLTALGQLAADLNITPQQLGPVADRWKRSLKVPTPFPLTARFIDERSGLVGRFLPRHDPRGLYLGLLTDCCQYPGSAGDSCAWAGHEHASMGFFVVENDAGDIVAQSWAWVDGNGRLCFDSVERKVADRQALLVNADDDQDEEEWEDTDQLDFGADPDTRSGTRKGRTKLNRAQRRAWAIRRVYRQAAAELLDRFVSVTVGPATSLPMNGLDRADGNLVADPVSVGYRGYRDSFTQTVLARRAAAAEAALTVTGSRHGFAVEAATTAGKGRVVVHEDGKVVVSGRGGAALARQVLAGMGPRTWAVRNSRGPVADPDDAGWVVEGPAPLAVPDYDEVHAA